MLSQWACLLRIDLEARFHSEYTEKYQKKKKAFVKVIEEGKKFE